jgi:translocation and assembly module TamB
MKRVTLSFVLLALLISISGMWFVLNTQWGLERFYALVQHSIPGKISVQTLHGKVVGPIKLTGLNYKNNEIDVSLDMLELDWQPSRLLSGTFRLTELNAHDLTVKLTTPSSEGTSKPLPDLTLPLAIDVLEARLSKALISRNQKQLVLIKRLELEGTAKNSSIQLAQLRIETEQLDSTVYGQLGLSSKQSVELHTNWTARFTGLTPLNGTGTFTGSLKRLALQQTVKQPGCDVTLHGYLANVISEFNWNLSLDIRQLDARQLASSWPDYSTRGKLKSNGRVAEFSLSGELASSLPKYGTLHTKFEINAKPQVWHLTSFTTKHTATDGTLHAGGYWHPGPDFGTLDLSGNWNQVVFPLSADSTTHQFSSNSGKFTFNGNISKYTFTANADLAGQRLPLMQLKLAGHGDRKHVKIPNIKALTLDGNVSGSATVNWQPTLDWQTTLVAKNINPAGQWPDWPGLLNAQIHAFGKQSRDNEKYGVELKSLNGKLRDYPVDAHGSLTWGNKKFEVHDAKLILGDSHLIINGGRKESWNLLAELTSPNIHALWPYSRGKLETRVNVTGAQANPHIIAKINGENLVFADYRIGALAGDFDIDLQSDEKFITTFSASEIAKDATHWQSITLNADGVRTRHQIKLTLKSDTDFIQVTTLAGLTAQQVWQGEIAQTIINVKEIGEWQQLEPAPFHISRKQASLGPWCVTQLGSHICLDGERQKNIWNASLNAGNLPLATFKIWLPPRLKLQGKTNIDSKLQYVPKRKLHGNLVISMPDGFTLLVEDREQSFHFQPGKIQASLDAAGFKTNVQLPAGELGELTLRLSLPDWNPLTGLPASQPLTGDVKASLTSLQHLNGFFLDYPALSGSLKTKLQIAGTVGTPLVTGETNINQASAEIPALGIKLSDINLRAHSNTGKQLNYLFSARSGETESIKITGHTLLQMPDGWPTKLNINGNNFQLANLPDVKINVSPQLHIEIQGRRIDFTGEIVVPHARFRPRTLPASSISPSQDVVIIDEADLSPVKERWRIYSHVRVIFGDHVYFDGFGLRGDLGGNLLLIDEPGKLTVGQGEIKIAKGTYKAYGQDAKIRRGRLMFANTLIDNPGIDLEAVREVDTVVAGVRVHGTLKQPELTLFSEPAMSDSDIISYFLLGRPLDTTEDTEGQQLQKALLAARLAGGEYFVEQTDIYSYVDELTFETDKTTEQTSLVVGKYLSPKLYVRYVTGIIESSNIAEIHYKLDKHFHLQTEAGYRGSSSVTGGDIYYTIEY